MSNWDKFTYRRDPQVVAAELVKMRKTQVSESDKDADHKDKATCALTIEKE